MDSLAVAVVVFALQITIISSERYLVLPLEYTFQQASDSCANQNGLLPVANTDALMVRLEDEMSTAGTIEMWVNAKETLYPWKWVSDANKEIERDQGCFLESALQGFTFSQQYERMKRDQCIDTCRAKGNEYAGFMTSERVRPNYGECRCGDVLSASGVSNNQWCDAECPGDKQPSSSGIPPLGFCGEITHTDHYYRVFHTSTAGHNDLSWEVGPVKDSHLCGAVISQELPDQMYYYTKKLNCSVKYNYICHLPDYGNLCDSFNNDGSCYTVSEGSDVRGQKTWFEARQACLTYGGDLAFVNTDIAIQLNDDGYLIDAVEYWVGLTARHWQWNNMDSPAFLETAWSPGQPTGIDQHCLLMDKNLTWTNEKCSEKHSYFCRIETPDEKTNAPLTIPTFAPISSTPSTTTTTTTTPPPEQTDDPELQSQEKAGLTKGQIAGIVVGIIIGLMAIAVVVIVGILFLRKSGPVPDENLSPHKDERDGYTNPAFASSRATSMQDIGPDGVVHNMASNNL